MFFRMCNSLATFQAMIDEIFKKEIEEDLIIVVTNNSFLLFSFDMLLPYAFHLTYLNMSFPIGIHKSPNTCLTCVCLMVNTPLPHIYHMFNMLFTHVHVTFCYYLNW
jgi:hypothetical protein